MKRGLDCAGRSAKPPACSDVGRRRFLRAGAAAAVTAVAAPVVRSQGFLTVERNGIVYRRIPTQFIAALAEPDATAGDNAHAWGLWRQDPGPRGVRLDRFDRLIADRGIAPAKWTFDRDDWWLEEHGLLMEQPEFPLPPGRYLVTGDREVTTVLTVSAPSAHGGQAWALADGATVYDVTHLRCRSARYTRRDGACTPAQARMDAFPVSPGARMPRVEGCEKQDYAVLFVIGLAVT